MRIQWRQKADSWHDWGLCELYDVLLSCEWPDGKCVQISEPDSAGFDFIADVTPAEFGAAIQQQMAAADRWNDLHPRFQEGKKISRCAPTVKNGRRVPGEKYDPQVSKEEWIANGCKGDPPKNQRNKAQRISNVPEKSSRISELFNVLGGEKSFEAIARDAVTDDLKIGLLQGDNPFVAKHHSNGKARGFSMNSSPFIENSSFLLPCILTTVSTSKPFVYNPDPDVKRCTIYLPENIPFDRSLRLWGHLKRRALIHPDVEQGEMYRNVPFRGDGEEAQLLMLLDALQSRLAPVRSSGDLEAEDIPEFNDWMALNYSSGTNVNVGVIHRIQVPGTVFPLLKTILSPSHWKETVSLTFVRDCLSGVRMENTPIQSHIAAALFQKQKTALWHDLENCAFSLYKNTDDAGKSNRRAVSLLPHFFAHFAKELLIMNDDQLMACRKIGELAGNAFSRDVTLLSRLHNSAKASDLRENLELFAFRLMKASNGDERGDLWHISSEQFRTVLELAHTDEWAAASQTISLFASLAAFNKNLGQAAAK
jgi:hypothetical protein